MHKIKLIFGGKNFIKIIILIQLKKYLNNNKMTLLMEIKINF